jgi:hypothetical protein
MPVREPLKRQGEELFKVVSALLLMRVVNVVRRDQFFEYV